MDGVRPSVYLSNNQSIHPTIYPSILTHRLLLDPTAG